MTVENVSRNEFELIKKYLDGNFIGFLLFFVEIVIFYTKALSFLKENSNEKISK